MKPAPFELVRPDTLAAALHLLARHADDARPLAGGQTLVPVLNLRLATPSLLVDLNRIAELSGVRLDGDGLRIGAMTRQARLLDDPLIARFAPLMRLGAAHIGHLQTRNRGTVGGSLAHADPSAELPLLCVVLDAVFTLCLGEQVRSVPAREFFTDGLTTVLHPGELLTEIRVPLALPDVRCSFREIARRHGDFAIAAVAVQKSGDRLSAGIGGLESRPMLCESLSASAEPGFDRSRLPKLIAESIRNAEALGDVHATPDHRRRVAEILLGECMGEVLR